MDLEVTWYAGYVGNHDVCLRVQGTLGWTNCQVVNCILGNNSAIFTVPDNFCDEITYEGYILAECEEVNPGGEGAQFAMTINQKVDPCLPYEITCITGSVQLEIFDGGALYQIGDVISADGTPVYTVLTIDGSGGILTLLGPLLPIPQWLVVPVITIATVSGVGALLIPTLSQCTPLLASCDGANNSGSSQPTGITVELNVGESVYLCSETAPVLPAQMSVTPLVSETCHCEDCTMATVTNPTAEALWVYYTTYNLGTYPAIVLWKERIGPGALNTPLSNLINASSLSYDVGLTVVFTPCT